MFKKAAVVAFLTPMLLLGPVGSQVASADEAMVAMGKKVAFDRQKGNCLACHMIDDGTLPGNQGPPLVAMKARFPDKEKLIKQISDPLSTNPNTIMPPFGVHNILSDDEIDAIAEYLLTL